MSGFWIDVYDSAGVKENGTTINVSDVQLSEQANRIGQVSFTLSAVEALAIDAIYGKRYRLYSAKNGYVGSFKHRSISVDADGRTANISADDSLLDLANQIVGFNKSYTNTNVKAIIESLVLLANPDWTVVYEPGVSTYFQDQAIALEFQGENILTALDFLRNYVRGWFRRSGDTQITFGRFRDLGFQNTYYNQSTRVQTDGTVAVVPTKYGDATWAFKYNGNNALVLDSEIDAWLVNVPVASSVLQRSTQYTQNDGTLAGVAADLSIITSLSQEIDGTSIVNRVIPRGSGQGITIMDLRYSTWTNSPFEIKYDIPGDYYYIEDTASQTQYGVVTRVLPFSEVRPITNSAADLQAAGNALYALSVAYLRKFRAPFQVYRVQCVNLPETAEIGSVVLIDFRGVATLASGDAAWLTIDRVPFFIIEKTTRWLESGEAVYELVVSSNGEGNISTTDIFKNAMEEIRKFQARPEPTITYYSNANPTLPIQAYDPGDPTANPPVPSTPMVSAELPFSLDAGVLLINDMTLEMKLTRFTAYSVTAIKPGSFTVDLPPADENTTADTGGHLTQANENNPMTEISGFHNHRIGVLGTSDATSYPDGRITASGGQSYLYAVSGSSMPDIVTQPDYAGHSHGFRHTHPLNEHTHKHDHHHGITGDILDVSFGIAQSSQLPTNVLVYFGGDKIGTNIVTGWTVETNEDQASTDGTLCTGAGLFSVNLTNYFPPAGSDHEGRYRVSIQCGANGGLVFARLLGRITVQPIAV